MFIQLWKVGAESRVVEHMYALGDCAVVNGAPQPATAQAANQQVNTF